MNYYDFAPGTLLGNRYRVRKQLGQGAFGIVYSASHEIFGTPQKEGLAFRDVALKIFKDQFVNRDNVHEVFKEAIVIEQLHSRARASGEHLNAVAVYDIGVFEDLWLPYVAMELVEGGALNCGVVPLKDGVGILRKICATMKVAHTEGVIHRDLKPDNVLFAKSGVMKVSDFGLAIPRHEALAFTGKAGTVSYTPPDSGTITPAFDVYSLGIMLLEFILHENPLNEVVRRKLPLRQAQERLADLLHPIDGHALANDNLELRTYALASDVLRKCLKVTASARYKTAGELDIALEQLAQRLDDPGHALPPTVRSCDDILRTARKARDAGNLSEAQSQLREADRRCTSGDPRLHAEWSHWHDANGDLIGAIQAQERSVDSPGGRTRTALDRLAALYDRNKQTLKARALREEARWLSMNH